MDQIIKTTVDAYMATFDAYDVEDDTLRSELDVLKNDINRLGESCMDATEFMSRFAAEGFQDQFTNLISKIHMASSVPVQNTEDTATNSEGISVREYVEQYRVPYNEVRAGGYRYRAEKAYEEVFNVAERTDDMLDAQIILEKERLLFNIVREDFIDIAEDTLAATDPNYFPVYLPLKMQMDSYLGVNSDEELTYESELAQIKKEFIKTRETARMTAVAALSYLVFKWMKCKHTIKSWPNDRAVSAASEEMIKVRKRTREFYKFMCDTMGLDYENIEASPFLSLSLLSPVSLDELSRIKKVQNPENLDAVKQILFDEILSDKKVGEILLETQPYVYYFPLVKKKDKVTKRYKEKAEQLDSDIPYYSRIK